MTLKFTFFCKGANVDYFASLLRKIARHFELKSFVESNDEILAFYASGENLGDFATALENEIPLSLYFRFKNAEVCKTPKHLKPLQIAESSENILSVSEINAIKNPKDSRFCDIFNVPSLRGRQPEAIHESKIDSCFTSLTKQGEVKVSLASPMDCHDFTLCVKSRNDSIIISQDSLQSALKNLCDLLKNGHKITLSTSKGKIALFTQKKDLQKKDSQKDFDFILANDISTLNLYTRATQGEINALASFEKPLVNLNIKEVFISEVGAKNALFILPFDIILCCISSILLDFEIPFLYAQKIAFDSSVDLAYKSANNDRFFEIAVGEKGYFLEKNLLDLRESSISNLSQFLDLNFADFAPQKRESKNDSAHDSSNSQDIFIAYISTENPTLIAPFSTKMPFVKIAFDKNPKNILAKISTLENGDKLIANFAREFEARYKAIQALDSAPQLSQNITDIFECATMILDAKLNTDSRKSSVKAQSKNFTISPKQSILNFANDCIRDIGPKIDFKNTKRENAIFYDEIRTIRSIISFTLAGSEREIIAFGLLESLIDYLVLLFRDAQSKFGIKSVGIIGDMFANKIFFDKITKKIPADFDLVFPKYLDFRF